MNEPAGPATPGPPAAPDRAWEPAPLFTHPHGVLRAVAISDVTAESISSIEWQAVLGRLLPEERALTAGMPPARLSTWIAGRLALAAALAELGAPRAPLLSTARGAPRLPQGFVGSVSHKKHLAIALAAPDEGAHLGVDLEDEEVAPPRYDIAPKILTAVELATAGALPPEARRRAVLAWFSIKESIYKAVDPFVQRYVGFGEAEVELGPITTREIAVRPVLARLSLERGEGPFAVEATWAAVEGRIVSSARVRPAHAAQT